MSEELKLKGLILRETELRENDKFMTVLTDSHGLMSVYGARVRSQKDRNFSACQLFSYSEFVVKRSGDKCYLKEAALIHSFFIVSDDLVKAALAYYIVDVLSDMAREEDECLPLLRLGLNCLYCLTERSTPAKQVKAVFELRALSEIGYAPDLVGCRRCGRYDSADYYFDIEDGCFKCRDCYHTTEDEMINQQKKLNESEGIYPGSHLICIVSPSTMAAMRHVVYSPAERIFAFNLLDEAMDEFGDICEKYLLCHLERGFKTLDFYRAVVD